MKNKPSRKFLLCVFCTICAATIHGYGAAPALTEDHQKIQEMYQEKYLEPGFLGGYINWGYWTKNKPHRISNQERIDASKELYRRVFKAAKISKKDSVLEVGCGKGRGMKLLFEEVHPQKAVGLDLNSRFISLAKQESPDSRISFVEGDACDLQFAEEFSKLICVEASQHFLDMDSFLLSANKSLKKGGNITIAGFFTKQDSDLEYLKDKIATIKNNIDLVRNINDIKKKMIDSGFKNVRVISIGSHVIPQYEDWLKQVSYENMWAKEWKTAFEKGAIDYYIITAEKVNTAMQITAFKNADLTPKKRP
ncbi:MAG: hypothetical protein Tsb0015_14900 [Simkaniaceae bacterium]